MIKHPENISTVAGTEIRLTCVIAGRPQPEVTWSRLTGTQLPVTRSYTLENGSILVIRDVSPADGDVYVCLGENEAGSVRANARVDINCKLLFSSPFFCFSFSLAIK